MPGWIGGFVNPALLAGLALGAVPVIIHLLNRRRHRPVPWAAMRFVLAAYQKTRRRVQLENLLLLLLRTAVILLLALAVARPFTGGASPLASLTESRRDLVLLVDASASTGYREEVETVHERLVERARALLRDLDAGRGDRVRLFLAAGHPRLLSWTSPEDALALLDTLARPTDEELDLAAALGEVLELAREDAGTSGRSALEVRLLTDLQRRSFLPEALDAPAAAAPAGRVEEAEAAPPEPDSPREPALVEVLDALFALDLRVLVEDLGPADPLPPNLGVVAVEPLEPRIEPGVPVDIGVTVRNWGGEARGAQRVALLVDGERRPNQLVDVPARGRAQAVFQVVFTTPGEHVLEAVLEGDRLVADDRRARVVDVPPPVRVLLVNGAPAADIEEDETGYLGAVLSPPSDDGGPGWERRAPFAPRTIPPEQLLSADVELSTYDVVWLANVDRLPADAVEALERHVAAGASLVISLGDRVDLEGWNRRLFRADGTGLLPAELVARRAVASRRDSYYRVAELAEAHPALSFFADDLWRPLMTEVPVYEFVATRPLDDARTLAALDDERGSPLLVERAYDRGRVLLWTTTIDPAWTRLPESPRTLVPLVHELVLYGAERPGSPRNLAPGEPLAAEVDSFPREVELVRPDGTRRPVDGEPEELGGGRWRLPQVPAEELAQVGTYALALDGAGGRSELSFAVRLDPVEGDLARLGPGELEGVHRALVALAPDVEGRPSGEPETAQRGELWRALAAACLVALVLESLWAAWIGSRRRAA